MDDNLVKTLTSVEKMTIDPQDHTELIAAVRAITLLLNVAVKQGRISAEAHGFLQCQYTKQLNRLRASNVNKTTKGTDRITARCKSKYTREQLQELINKTTGQKVNYLKDEEIRYAVKHAFVQPTEKERRENVEGQFNIKEFVADSLSNTKQQMSKSENGKNVEKKSNFTSAKAIFDEENQSNKGLSEKVEQTKTTQNLLDHPDLKCVGRDLTETILGEMMTENPTVNWTDIAGLEFAKQTITEMVIWPLLRPDIFKGLREPPKGLLLFGPPGTGKTLIGKCIASQAQATFFSISASSLTSKWMGESEKLVRALFAVARIKQPAVIFIDEIDSLLSKRDDSEAEGVRKMKTEFLVQLDGARCHGDNRVVFIGATNRPQELDDAARRRLVKRIYIPLPNSAARKRIIEKLLASTGNNLTNEQMENIAQLAEG